jgi:CBS domain-containing protein
MNESVSTLMTRRVHAVDMDDSVAQVEELLARERLTWAPVLEHQRLVVGVISAADLLQFHAQRRDPLAVPAWQLCTYKPITVDQATPLVQVARAMVEQGVHHVVVTNQDSIVGVVSSLDFVRAFVDGR